MGVAIGVKAVTVGAKTDTGADYVNLKPALLIMALLTIMYAAARVYQQIFGWSAGLDSTLPEFQTYWMNFFWTELAVEAVVGAGLWSCLWFTRDRHLDKLSPKEELRRYFNLVGWLMVYAFAVYFAVSFFAEQDAAWHQTVVRDTSLTPSHIILFYLGIPTYVIAGVGAFLYAMTRLPRYASGISVPFVLAVTGPFMILPNLGYNEWGHAFWLMEEVFGAPLHWGFVVLGWSVLALGGVLLQGIHRMIELLHTIFPEMATKHSGTA